MASKLKDELRDLKAKADAPGGVLHFWMEVLEEEERQRLGESVDVAEQRFGRSTGMWIELHGGSLERAVVDVAAEIGLIDDAKRRRLLRRLGDEPEPFSSGLEPRWDASSGKLYLDGEVIRRVRKYKHPSNVQRILDSFQRAGWPREIDNPLGGDQKALHDTLTALHRKLKRLRFHATEGGKSVWWERR